MKVLVTGGAGFIGMNLVRMLVSRGHEVSVIDDLSTGYRDNLNGVDVDFHYGSVLDADLLGKSMEGADSVIHLAALGSVPRSIADPLASHHANATGTLNVVMAAKSEGVSHIVAASSSSVYGLNPAMPKAEREWVRPMSPYAVTKLATEQYVLASQQSFGLRSLAFRFFNVYGPGQRSGHVYAAVIPVFLDHLLRDEPLPINGDGSNSRDFTFVGTVCKVLVQAVEEQISHPEPVNLAFGTNTSLNNLVKQIETVTSLAPQVNHRPPRAGDVQHSCADSSQLKALFPGVEPVSLADGLEETFRWFKETP